MDLLELGEPDFKEVIITSDSSHSAWNCCVWDPDNGNSLASFRGGNSAPHGLDLIGQDYIVSALKNEPIIRIWSATKVNHTQFKFPVPAPVSALAVTQSGQYLVAGIKNKIYTWQVSTGNLCSIIEQHTGEVSCIKFTDSDRIFITGGKDSFVFVWYLHDAVSHNVNQMTMPIKPIYSWNDHRTSITDIFVGFGGHNARVATVSMDETCKMYKLSDGQLLFSVYTDVPLTAITMDAAECFLAIGTERGVILQIPLFSCMYGESVDVEADKTKDMLIGHSQRITSLSTSHDGKCLVSASYDATVRVWNVFTKQCIQVIQHIGPVTNAFFMMAMSPLLKFEKSDPSLAISPLKLSFSPEGWDNVAKVRLRSGLPTSFFLEPCDEVFNEMSGKRLMDSNSENKAKLQADIVKTNSINKQLYSFCFDQLVFNLDEHKLYNVK